jgi:hypothetical protein
MRSEVYKAGPPRRGEWVFQWQTDAMPAPAFNYFKTKAEAEAAARAARRVMHGVPRAALQVIHSIYDNGGESLDRYTVLLKDGTTEDIFAYLTLSDNPDHLLGVSQYGTGAGKQLGRRIELYDLPLNVLYHVIRRLEA